METKQQMAAEAGVSVIQLPPHPDSLSTASVKEYAPSFSSEPPPAYQRPRSTAVQVARIAGVTLVAASAVLGAFLLAAAWITAKHSCSHHVIVPMQASHSQGHEHLPSFDRLVDPLQASEQKLEVNKVEQVAANALGEGDAKTKDDDAKKEDAAVVKETDKGDGDEEESVSEEEDEDEDGSDGNSDENPIQIRVPLQLDFDELAGMLMERNLRSRMNCVVEKRKAEEVVEHRPRTLQLPFGLNLTTDPRHEMVTGERMAIFCESGHDQMQQQQRRPEMPFEFIPLMTPQQQPVQQVQPEPMIVPLPGPIHLPFHFMGPMQHQQVPNQQPQHQQPIPMHPQAPHLEEPHMQGSMPQPHQQTIHIFSPVHPQGMPQSDQYHQEMLRRQMIEQEQALENMRPPPPPVPSAHQLPPHQQAPPVHHMPQMGPLPGHQGPIISVHHLLALAEGASEEEENQEPEVGRAFREQIPQRLPVHIPMQGNNIRGPSIPMPEEHRPHYVQPRSVPSDPFTGELHRRDKRVKKRCACDCSC